MKHTRTWTDVYGSACASFEGRAGGHTWLVAAPPELAASVPAGLEALDGKGTALLLVHDGLTPLLSAAQEFRPRGVLVVAAQALTGGPAIQVEPRTVSHDEATEYVEGGTFPAWQSAFPDQQAKTGESAAASAAASVGVPVTVSSAASVQQTLERWMDATPHGR